MDEQDHQSPPAHKCLCSALASEEGPIWFKQVEPSLWDRDKSGKCNSGQDQEVRERELPQKTQKVKTFLPLDLGECGVPSLRNWVSGGWEWNHILVARRNPVSVTGFLHSYLRLILNAATFISQPASVQAFLFFF